jgi:hypothetical protein
MHQLLERGGFCGTAGGQFDKMLAGYFCCVSGQHCRGVGMRVDASDNRRAGRDGVTNTIGLAGTGVNQRSRFSRGSIPHRDRVTRFKQGGGQRAPHASQSNYRNAMHIFSPL